MAKDKFNKKRSAASKFSAATERRQQLEEENRRRIIEKNNERKREKMELRKEAQEIEEGVRAMTKKARLQEQKEEEENYYEDMREMVLGIDAQASDSESESDKQAKPKKQKPSKQTPKEDDFANFVVPKNLEVSIIDKDEETDEDDESDNEAGLDMDDDADIMLDDDKEDMREFMALQEKLRQDREKAKQKKAQRRKAYESDEDDESDNDELGEALPGDDYDDGAAMFDNEDMTSFWEKMNKRQQQQQQQLQGQNKLSEEEKYNIIMQQQPEVVVSGGAAEEKEMTFDEIQRLKDTQNLFSSSLFSMAFGEMLKEIRVDFTKTKPIEDALVSLKTLLDTMPATTLSDAIKLCSDCGFKLRNDAKKFAPIKTATQPQKGKKAKEHTSEVVFTSPSDFAIAGSFLLRSVAKPVLNVDLAVQIPPTCFTSDDITDSKYFDKRTMYLCVIAKFLKQQQNSAFSQVSFATFRHDRRKPILVIRPKKDEATKKSVATKFIIRVFPTISKQTFPLEELAPSKNNLTWHSVPEGFVPPPSPFYNSAILEDMFFTEHLEMLHRHMQNCPALIEAAMLFKVWSRQRLMNDAPDTVNGFLFSMLLIYLVESRTINKHMSSNQMFRTALNFIVNFDVRKGLAFKSPQEKQEPLNASVKSFLDAFPVVLLDPLRVFNIFSRVSAGAWKDLQFEAKQTLTLLEDQRKSNAFEMVFLKKISIYEKFDAVLCVKRPVIENVDDQIVTDMPFERFFETKVIEILEKAFSDRITSITPVFDEAASKGNSSVVIGLMLNPDNCTRVLDMGPPADDKAKVKEFKEFWGSKAEMRRFKDGAINMATVWMYKSSRKWIIIESIAKHILAHHLQIPKVDTFMIGRDLYSALETAKYLDPIEITPQITAAFEDLSKALKEVETHLYISEIIGISPAFRYMAVLPPLMNIHASATKEQAAEVAPELITDAYFTDPLNVLLTFERSGAWPDDVIAIRLLKTQFYYAMADGLTKRGFNCTVSQNFLDVACGGFVFRLVISVPKEIELLKRSGYALEDSVRTLEKEMIKLPEHIRAIQSIHFQHPALSLTVRLVKRWMQAHLFGGYIDDAAIELLCVHVFTSPYPYTAPRTPVCAFLRVLSLLAKFDWDNEPLMLDMDPEEPLTAQHVKEMTQTFEALKDSGNAPAMFITTPRDPNSIWTRQKPNRQVMQRIRLYAQSSLQMFNALKDIALTTSERQDWRSMFRNSGQEFDTVITTAAHFSHNNTTMTTRRDASVPLYDLVRRRMKFPSSNRKHMTTLGKRLIVGMDPLTSYLEDLKYRFGDIAAFFMDKYYHCFEYNRRKNDAAAETETETEEQGDKIYVAWNPVAFLPSDFKVANATATMPIAGGKIIPNVFEILSDFRSMGQGMVAHVRIVSHSANLATPN